MENSKISVVFDFFGSLAYKLPTDPVEFKLPHDSVGAVKQLREEGYSLKLLFTKGGTDRENYTIANTLYPDVFNPEDVIQDLPPNMLTFLVSDQVEVTKVSHDRNFRGIWYNNYYTNEG